MNGNIDSAGRRSIALGLFLPVMHGAILGLAGGGLWREAAVYLVVFALVMVVELVYLAKKNPEVLNARGKRQEGTQPWDKTVLKIHVVLMLSLLVVAGLDAGRYNWSEVTGSLEFAGLFLVVSGFGMGAWAMGENRHFEPTVRLQSDRDQHVIAGGPYNWVRHPGYVGMILAAAGIPLAVGSFYALIPALAEIILFILRTRREDQFLMENLEGYRNYASAVPRRLCPFW